MQTLSEIRTYVSDVIEDDSTETLSVIDKWINKALKNLCDKYTWAGYTREKTITPDSTTGAFYVPAGFAGVIRIYPYDESFGSFLFMSPAARRGNRLTAPYYMETTCRLSGSSVATDATVTNNSNIVTTATNFFSSSNVGQTLLIGNSGYEYEIASYSSATSVTITPEYRGESVTGEARITINPIGQRQFIVYNTDDTPYTDNIVLIYKVFPQPLYNDYDRPLINADEAIKLGTLIECLRNEKYSVDAERIKADYLDAVNNARQSEVKPPKIRLPKGMLTPMPPFSFHTNRNNLTNRE